MTSRFDAFQRRHPVIGFPLAVVYKFIDDQGSYLAALIAYYALVSLIPLLLLLATGLGIVLVGYPQVQQQVLNSAAAQFPVVGDQLNDPGRLGGGTLGFVIGGAGALYGALGVAQAFQNALHVIWAVPRNSRPNPLVARGRSLLLLATVGLALISATVVSAIGSGLFDLGSLGRGLAVGASVLINTVAFALAIRIGSQRRLSVGDVLPGAVIAATVLQGLQLLSAVYVRRVVVNASNVNSVFAIILGLLAFLFLAALGIVIGMEVNAVRKDRLSPRSLLTPFTDAVELTAGDRRVYRRQAEATRSKGFERVDVSFSPPTTDPPDDGTDDPPRRN